MTDEQKQGSADRGKGQPKNTPSGRVDQPPEIVRPGLSSVEAGLDDGTLALIDETCLHRSGVDAEDLVTVAREATRGDHADIPQTEN